MSEHIIKVDHLDDSSAAAAALRINDLEAGPQVLVLDVSKWLGKQDALSSVKANASPNHAVGDAVVTSIEHDATTARVALDGGRAGQTYTIQVSFQSTANRTLSRSPEIAFRDQPESEPRVEGTTPPADLRSSVAVSTTAQSEPAPAAGV